MRKAFALPILAAALAGVAAPSGAAATDPDWPCIQRKVPELSLGQIWNGPDLPAASAQWQSDKDIADLVEEIAARRVPLADAQGQIRSYAQGLKDGRADKLGMLAAGLFDHMNAERSQIISGIGRYAHKQADMAAAVRKEAAELDQLRAKPDASATEITDRTDRLNWDTRIFEERVQSLSYVCEVPTLIEQRLFQLSKTVAEEMKR